MQEQHGLLALVQNHQDLLFTRLTEGNVVSDLTFDLKAKHELK